MTLLWTLRFFDEFFKMNQEAFEDNLPLNMGQLLSIPLVLSGLFMMYWFYTRGTKTMAGEDRKTD
jgi:prolipoprotein diacylglyceryltransferase